MYFVKPLEKNTSMKTKYKKTGKFELSQDASEQNRIGLERLVFFSDAVFAIAITVLILDIHLPVGGETASNSQLFNMLIGLWHKYLAYIISFWVIGLYWISHHRKFLLIKRFDYRLLSLNLLLLMVIAFIPFPTAVMSENGNRTATIFYALTMAAGGLLVVILWWHAAHNHRLIEPLLARQLQWREVAAPLTTMTIFLLSIGIAFLNESLVRICWILILPISFISNNRQ
jgi:uncharacterized membrane protein